MKCTEIKYMLYMYILLTKVSIECLTSMINKLGLIKFRELKNIATAPHFRKDLKIYVKLNLCINNA